MEEERLSRKEFLKKGLFAVSKPFTYLINRKIEGMVKRRYIRPPGAVEEVAFLSLCTKCDLCKDACPYGAIRIVGSEGGLAMGTPYIDPLKSPCRLCDDLPCVKACPEGALREVDRREVRMGIAVISTKRCLAWQNMLCDTCVTSCPFTGEAISIDGLSRPVIHRDRCTGCGICAHTCVTRPSAIKVQPL